MNNPGQEVPRGVDPKGSPPTPLPWQVWVHALVLASVGMGLLQLAQHQYLMRLPMLWYHLVATVLNAVVVATVVVLYLQWRLKALQVQAAWRDLKASEELREDLTNMLVHDLKNPLTASLGSLRLVLGAADEQPGSLSQSQRDLLTVAVNGQKRLARMIEDLLDIAQAQAGELALHRETTDVAGLVSEAVAEAQPAAERNGLRLHLSLDAAPRLAVDADKLRRVVDNLLANALKFTPSGGTVTVTVDQREGEVHVNIADTGEGIPEHLQEHIFDKFGQAQAARHGHRMSVGLGLAFSQLVVKAHGGLIKVQSEPGAGSVFTVELPLSSRPRGTDQDTSAQGAT